MATVMFFLPRKNFKVNIKNVTLNGMPIVAPIIASPLEISEQVYELNFMQLTTDADGAGVGLEDLDADGEFDDLAPGKTVIIRYEEKWNCDIKCPIDAYNVAPCSAVIYTTMCGSNVTTGNLILSTPYYNYLSESINVIAPAQVEGGVAFTTQVCMNGQWNTPVYKPTDSLYLEVTLPPGFSLAGTGNITINGLPATAAQYSFTGNKLTIVQKGHAEAICFSYDLIYTCGVSGDVSINYTMRYVGDNSCACQEKINCVDKLINIKCISPCSNGIINYKPVVKRISMGYTDKTLTTKVSSFSVTGIALKSALPKDTLVMSIRGWQITADKNLHYFYQLDKANGDDVLQFVSGIFYHKSFSSGLVSSCTVAAPVMSSTATVTKFTYNFTSCLTDGKIKNKDSVWVDIQYAVTKANNGLLYGNKLTTVPNTLSYFYNLDGGNNEVYCDFWSTDFLLCGVKIIEEGYSSAAIMGCGYNNLHGEVKPYYEDGNDLFPNEYRPVCEVDSIVVILPAGYEYDNTATSYMGASYWNSLFNFTSYTNVAVIPELRGNKVILKNPKNGSWNLSDYSKSTNYQHNRYFVPVRATCQTPNGNSRGGTEFYTKNYFYADKIGETYQKLYPTNFTTVLVANSINKPSVAIQNNSGVVAGVAEQHYWDVQISNPGTATAPGLWMAIEKGTSDISIDSVVFKPSNIIAAPITYTIVNKWYKLSTAGIAGGDQQQIRIYFKYLKCTSDSVKMLAGWNCSGYPSPDPTAYSCQAITQWLKVNPLPSQVQLAIIKQPDFPSSSLCSNDTVSVVVNSAQAGDVNNPVLKIIPPVGLLIVTPIRVEYPLGSGLWESITPTLFGGEYLLSLESHTGVGLYGLKGTVKKPFAADRQIKVDVMYETNCGFTNGTKLNFVVQGSRPCGVPAIGNNDEIKSNPINITGANAVGGAATDISISSGNVECGGSDKINFSITPLISPTTNTDTVKITLPAGVNYINGSFSGCGACTISSTPGAGGSVIFKLKLPANAAANTAINFSIEVNASQDAECKTYIVDVQTVRTGVLLNCGSFVCSTPTPVVLSSASNSITVKKASLQVLEFKLLGAGPFYSGGTYTCSVKVQNFGSIIAAPGYVAELFCIGDANPFAAVLLPALSIGQITTVTSSITIPTGCIGGLSLMAKIRRNAMLPAVNIQCLCDESYAINAIVLPVKIVSFKAISENNYNKILWKIANEIPGVKYEIQRSMDALVFETVKEITVTQTGAGEYVFSDTEIPLYGDKIFYRLQIIEVNGKISFSDIAAIFKSHFFKELTVSPNPARSSIFAQFYSHANQPMRLIMYDFGNRKVKEWNKNAVKGMNSVMLDDFGEIANGAYVLKVQGNNINLQLKLYFLK